MARIFSDTFYRDDSNRVYKMRARLDWSILWKDADVTTPPPITHPFHVKISKSSREFGLTPRHVILTKLDSAGTGSDIVTKKRSIRIVVQTKTAFDALTVGSVVTGGSPSQQWEISKKVNEQYS